MRSSRRSARGNPRAHDACSRGGGAGYSGVMDETTVTEAQDDTTVDSDDLVEEELLVEEISIDGMCGVY